jgi:hypothetical protein
MMLKFTKGDYNVVPPSDIDAAVDAIGYARSKGVAVANLSWSLEGKSEQRCIWALHRALRDADEVLFVAAVSTSAIQYPANFRLPNVVRVGSSARKCDRAAGDQSTDRLVDIAAPGEQVVMYNNDVDSGSSFAAPLVTGVALLLKSLAPTWSPVRLRQYLIDSADHTCSDRPFGVLDADRATAAPVEIQEPSWCANRPAGSVVQVRWRELFHSDACDTLTADLIDAKDVVHPNIGSAAAGASALFAHAPPQLNGVVRLRLRCAGTELRTPEVKLLLGQNSECQ